MSSLSQVHWLEQCQRDVPASDDWLSSWEVAHLATLRFPKRRADWRLGRWTAKCGVACFLALPGYAETMAGLEIRPATSGAPEVFLRGQPAPLTISLSHCAGRGICAVSNHGLKLGCDLELIEERSPAFISDYFTSEERKRVAQVPKEDRELAANTIWSAKESTLKALHEGLRLDTRSVVVTVENVLADVGDWSPLQAVYAGGEVFHGWWYASGNLVRTVVADSQLERPISVSNDLTFRTLTTGSHVLA